MTERLADGDRRDTAGRLLPIEKLARAVNEARGHDEEEERRLPLTRDERPVVKRRTPKKLEYWAQGFIR
jgi:hypothetical protein